MKNTVIAQAVTTNPSAINNALPEQKKRVEVTTTQERPGSWTCVAMVNGKFYSSSTCALKQDAIAQVRKDLAEGGLEMPKQLAPVMSAIMPKNDRRTEVAA